MTKDEFKNSLAAGLYDWYEADDPNILGVYPNSIEFGIDSTDREFPVLYVSYTRERKIGGSDTTAVTLDGLDELMDMMCDD